MNLSVDGEMSLSIKADKRWTLQLVVLFRKKKKEEDD